MFEALIKLKVQSAIVIVLSIAATLFPGSLLIFVTSKSLFHSLDAIKLILLSWSLTAPCCVSLLFAVSNAVTKYDADLEVTSLVVLAVGYTNLIFITVITYQIIYAPCDHRHLLYAGIIMTLISSGRLHWDIKKYSSKPLEQSKPTN